MAEGMTPICGRMFASLIFDGGPVSFSDMADRLNVSRGSVSTSARVLEQRGLLRRFKQGGRRGDFFDLPDDPYPGLIGGIYARTLAAQDHIEATLDSLSTHEDDRTARLRDLLRFYKVLQGAMQSALTQINGDRE